MERHRVRALASGGWPSYAIAGSDPGATGIYLGTMPPAIAPGPVSVYGYLQAGSAPAPTDTLIGTERNVYWDGSGLTSGGGPGVTAAQFNAAIAPLLSMLRPGFGYSAVGSATPTSFVLDPSDGTSASILVGLDVFIEGGTGANQSRVITSVSGNVATIDRPWDVVPAAAGDAGASFYFLYPPT